MRSRGRISGQERRPGDRCQVLVFGVQPRRPPADDPHAAVVEVAFDGTQREPQLTVVTGPAGDHYVWCVVAVRHTRMLTSRCALPGGGLDARAGHGQATTWSTGLRSTSRSTAMWSG